jgi:hypothetical protein
MGDEKQKGGKLRVSGWGVVVGVWVGGLRQGEGVIIFDGR